MVGLSKKETLSWNDVCPIIGQHLLNSELNNNVFNNEHIKGHKQTWRPSKLLTNPTAESIEKFISGGELESIFDLKKEQLVKALNSFGFEGQFSSSSKNELIERIFETLESDYGECRKIFTKPNGTTGGWMFACCEHGIIICVKPLLRAEGPQVCKLPNQFRPVN